MADRKTEFRAEPKLREAAARTAEALQTLQSRLKREAAAQSEEGPDDLGRQLNEYFAESAEVPGKALSDPMSDDLRELVIRTVVEKVLRAWSDPNSGLSDIRKEVIARLAERVLEELKDKK